MWNKNKREWWAKKFEIEGEKQQMNAYLFKACEICDSKQIEIEVTIMKCK